LSALFPFFVLLCAVTQFILSKHDIWAKQLYLVYRRQTYWDDTCRLCHVFGKDKSTVVPVSAMKAWGGVKVKLQPLLTSALDQSAWSGARLVRLVPGKDNRFPLTRREVQKPQAPCRPEE